MLKLVLLCLIMLVVAVSIIAAINLPVSAQIAYTHRRLLDDVTGNSMGWNPDGVTKRFGIVDSRFNPLTSMVLINTENYAGFAVCHVDHRGFGPGGPAFEVNCGQGDPSAVAPLDGSVLNYLIITMPFTVELPPVSGEAGGGIESLRSNMTDRMQIANQTQ